MGHTAVRYRELKRPGADRHRALSVEPGRFSSLYRINVAWSDLVKADLISIRSKPEFIYAQPLDAKLERRGRKPQRFRRPVRPRNAAA